MRDILKITAPYLLIMAVFTVWRLIFFDDVEALNIVRYEFDMPIMIPFHFLDMVTYTVFSFLGPNGLFFQDGTYRLIQPHFIINAGFVAIALCAYAIYKRNIPILFGLAFALATQFPTAFFANYDRGRFAYLGAIGGTVAFIGIIESAFPPRTQKRNLLSYSPIAMILMVTIFTYSAVSLRSKLNLVQQESATFERGLRIASSEAKTLPPQSIIKMVNVPEDYFMLGHGATEAIRLATGRKDLAALVLAKDHTTDVTRYCMEWWNTWPNAYSIDFNATPPSLTPVRLDGILVQ